MGLFVQTLSRLRVQVIAYGLGLAIWAGAISLIYPSIQSSIGGLEYPEAILDAFGIGGVSLADPRGFFGAEFFSLGPLVLGAFVVFAATAALAGEEAAGTMEMLAALPISRQRMFVQKALAVLLAATLVAALTAVGWAVTVPFVDLGGELTLGKLIGATLAQLPFAAFLVAAGLLLGAVAPSRSVAASYAGALLIVSYLLVAIGSAVESVEDIRYVSAYYYSDLQGVLIDGLTISHQLVLAAGTVLLGALGLIAFEGRELGGERWQFDAFLPRRKPDDVSAGAPRSGSRGQATGRGRVARWAILLTLVVIVIVAAAGMASYQYAESLPAEVSVSGRVAAPSVTILAPASGLVSLLTAAEGQEVHEGDILAWITNSVDNAQVAVTAPHAGRITSLELHEGQFAVAGTPVVEIHELQAMHVVIEVGEGDIARVTVGQSAELSFTSLRLDATATVGYVAPIPTANPTARPAQSRKYEVKIPLVGVDPRVVVGLPVEVRIRVDSRRP